MNSSRRRVPVKLCEKSEFGFEDQDITFFTSWEEFVIVCTDWSNETNMFKLYNDGYYIKYSTVNLVFDLWN